MRTRRETKMTGGEMQNQFCAFRAFFAAKKFMKPDDFEQRLQRQPVRQIPPDWRADILTAAREAQAPVRAAHGTQPSCLASSNQQLAALFWPHPKAWAGLAALWIIIFVLNFSVREASPMTAKKSAPPSPEVMVELKKQQRMFAELVGSHDPAAADRPRIFSPKPRSARAEILVT